MAGRVLRDSKGRFNGSTAGWQKGKKVARGTVNGARKKVSAYNNKVLRQEAFVAKGRYYERDVTRGNRNARVAGQIGGSVIGKGVAGPIGSRVGGNLGAGRVAARQQSRSIVNGQAKAINRKRANQLVRKEIVRSIKVQAVTTVAVGGGALLASGGMRLAQGAAGAHYARTSSLKANRALSAGLSMSKKRRGVYNVSSMGSRTGTGARIRLGGQRLSAAAKFAANAG